MHNRMDMCAVDAGRLKSHFEEVVPEPDFVIWRRPLYNVPMKTLRIVRRRKLRKYAGLEWAEGVNGI